MKRRTALHPLFDSPSVRSRTFSQCTGERGRSPLNDLISDLLVLDTHDSPLHIHFRSARAGARTAAPSDAICDSHHIDAAGWCGFAGFIHAAVLEYDAVCAAISKGLHVQAFLNRLEGDVAEIDGLNHYIGMRPLNEAAQLERQTSLIALIVLATLIGATVLIHSKWAAALAIPAVLFPAGFLLDLYLWLDHFGQNLDPKAALSSSIKPFTPPVLGEGVIGQFRTVASGDMGLWMACGASLIVIVGLYFHRRAYKPLMDRAMTAEEFKGNGLLKPGASIRRATAHGAALAISFVAVQSAHARDVFDLQAAINAAEPGATILVSSSQINGQIVIDRALTIVADGEVVIDGGNKGDVVKITAPDVAFRGFTVRGSGTSIEGENAAICATVPRATIENNIIEDALFGVSLKSASGSVIRGNTIRGQKLDIARRGDAIRIWQSHDVLVEDNTVSDGRDVVMWFADRVTLRRNHVVRCRYGMHFMYTHDNVIEDNRLEDNSVGAFLMYSRNLHVRRNVFARNRGPSGYGLGLKDMQGVIAENNVFAGNRVGVYLDNPPMFGAEFDTFTRNIVAFNDLGRCVSTDGQANRIHRQHVSRKYATSCGAQRRAIQREQVCRRWTRQLLERLSRIRSRWRRYRRSRVSIRKSV